MTLRRRILLTCAAGLMAVVGAALVYLASGSSAIESWVGSQLLEIGGTYLEPKLQFKRLTYLRPRTILLEDVTLSSPDPDKPGQFVVILAIKRARLELTEIPRRGKQIKFSKVLLESPEIHAIAAVPGGPRLLGFSHFVKGSPGSASTASTSPTPVAAGPAVASSTPVAGKAPRMKLSDLLLIRNVEIVNGMASYDSRMPDRLPVWLDQINARLDFTPAATADSGVYTVDTTIARKPAVDLAVRGQLNIDTFTLELSTLDLALDLQEKNVHVLPAQLQELLKKFEVTGQLHLTAGGTVPLTHFRQSTLHSQGELTAAQIAAGANRLSVDTFRWEIDLADGIATLPRADAQLLGGELHANGLIPLDGRQPARLELTAANLKIQKLLRAFKPGVVPPYGGNLSAAITYSAPLAKWNQQAAGSGTVSIRQGRIDNLPVLGSILTGLNNSLSKTFAGDGKTLTDMADGTFTFAGDQVQIDRFTGTSGALGFRATGTIGFDRRFALRLNAGPLERLQDSLGVIGGAWASVSDAIAGYRVTGTLDAPQVSMELGGAP